MTEKEREYEHLRDQCYARALDALLCYARLVDNIQYQEEVIEIEVNGLIITVKSVNI